MDIEKAFRAVDEREQAIIDKLAAIIGIDNSVPPGRNYAQLVDLMEPQFKRLGFHTERVIVPEDKVALIPLPLEGPRVNLVATTRNNRPPLTIYAHMDTVPVEEGWDSDPFNLTVKDERLYGRGVSDMKGTIAGLLTALEVMAEFGMEPAYDLTCCLCTDEEIGVYPGVHHLALEGYIKAPILCMEGSQDPVQWVGAAGAIDVAITTHGRSCHSGANFMGVNAVEEMIPILNELMALKHDVESRRSALPSVPSQQAPSDRLSPMFNLDIIHGGVKANIVPSKCTLVVNRRVIPEESPTEAIREIEEAVRRGQMKSKALSVDCRATILYPSMRQNPDSPWALRMQKALCLVQGYKPEQILRVAIGGSLDMAFVAQTLKTEDFVDCGIGRWAESNTHGANENIRVSDLKAHAKELIYFLSKSIDRN